MKDFSKHLIQEHATVKEALGQLNGLGVDAILLVTDGAGRLAGSITDGDIRRGFLKGIDFSSPLADFLQPNPVSIRRSSYTLAELEDYRNRNLKIIPVLDEDRRVVDVLNLRVQTTLLPLEAVLMAGGEGKRLRPLTDAVPKPLLPVGGKPIIEHNVDRLLRFGVNTIHISVKYLAQQLKDHFQSKAPKDAHISFLEEGRPLGTMGALSLLPGPAHDYVLVMNSDLLTDIDFEEMFRMLVEKDGDMIVATSPYHITIPYGVVEAENDCITTLREKPTYTYYSNAGIYMIKKSVLGKIPKDAFYNATDLIEDLLGAGSRVLNFPILGYWLDIGSHEAYQKAQHDIKILQHIH